MEKVKAGEGMDVYIYQADMYCADCGEAIRAELEGVDITPETPESEYDSGEYPKGPYPDGGGESDIPEHCAGCGLFLENPLTTDGYIFVRQSQNPEWMRFYEVE